MHPAADPSTAFAPPFLGPVLAAESAGDEYVPLALRWARHGSGSLYLLVGDGPQTRVELGFDLATHLLWDVTLVVASPEKWSTSADPLPDVPASDGLPRCNSGAWLARTRTGSLDEPRYTYLSLDAHVRVSLSPSEAVLHLDGLAGEVTMELASGRARCGVDAKGALAYVRLTELTAREAALLEEHRSRPSPHPK